MHFSTCIARRSVYIVRAMANTETTTFTVSNKLGRVIGEVAQRANGYWYATDPVGIQDGGPCDTAAQAVLKLVRFGAATSVRVDRNVGSHCAGVVEVDGTEVHRTRAYPYGFDHLARQAADRWALDHLR